MARFRQRGIRLDPLFGYFSFGSSSFSNDHHFPSVSFYSSIKMAAPSNCSFLLCYLCNSKERADSSLTLLSSPNFKLYFYSSVRYRDFLQFFLSLFFRLLVKYFLQILSSKIRNNTSQLSELTIVRFHSSRFPFSHLLSFPYPSSDSSSIPYLYGNLPLFPTPGHP